MTEPFLIVSQQLFGRLSAFLFWGGSWFSVLLNALTVSRQKNSFKNQKMRENRGLTIDHLQIDHSDVPVRIVTDTVAINFVQKLKILRLLTLSVIPCSHNVRCYLKIAKIFKNVLVEFSDLFGTSVLYLIYRSWLFPWSSVIPSGPLRKYRNWPKRLIRLLDSFQAALFIFLLLLLLGPGLCGVCEQTKIVLKN